MSKYITLLALTLTAFLATGATTKADTGPVVSRLAAADILKSDASFKTFLESLSTVKIEGPLPRVYYLMEGDLLLDEEQVRGALRDIVTATSPATAPKYPGELKVMSRNNKAVIWNKPDRKLTYAVARQSFPTKALYDKVVKNMAAAAANWVDACPTCGLSITHEASQDAAPNIRQVTFIVTYRPNETQFIAAAFFPYDEEARRYLLIAPSYFEAEFNAVGVLRHELGHVLGYRHEHIGGVSGCGIEDGNWKAVTSYDPKSVMHYYCGNGGTFDLEITPKDKAGHSELYK